jgi:hypothetical protein
MSLDVTLTSKTKKQKECAHCGSSYGYQEQLYSSNITHNLGDMADEAGIYQACWRPEEIGAKKASDISPILEKGLELMKSDPERFKKFNAENGWGLYEHFIPWVERYLNACKEYPDAEISVWR